MTRTAVAEVREVEAHLTLDEAAASSRARDKCVTFDLHGLWWSVPMELTLHDIAEAIAWKLEQLKLQPIPYHLGDVYRPVLR